MILWIRPVTVSSLSCRIFITAGVQEVKTASSLEPETQCATWYVIKSSQPRRNCTENKPGYSPAATLWTQSATATPLQLIHTDGNGMYLYNLKVKFRHFDYLLAKSFTVKLMYVYQKKKYPQNCILFVDGLNQVNVYNLNIVCCKLERLSTFIFSFRT